MDGQVDLTIYENYLHKTRHNYIEVRKFAVWILIVLLEFNFSWILTFSLQLAARFEILVPFPPSSF